MNTRVLEENKVIDAVLKKKNLGEDKRKGFIKVYNSLKFSVPEEIREYCSFGYLIDKKEGYIKMNIQSYKTFLLPYDKNQIQLVYPEEKVDTLLNIFSEARVKELCSFCKFSGFPCYVLYLNLEEALKFEEEHWKCFTEACELEAKAEKTRKINGTVKINWEEKIEEE